MHKLSMARDDRVPHRPANIPLGRFALSLFSILVQAIRGRPEWKKTNLPIHRMIDNFPDPAVFRTPASKIEVDSRNEPISTMTQSGRSDDAIENIVSVALSRSHPYIRVDCCKYFSPTLPASVNRVEKSTTRSRKKVWYPETVATSFRVLEQQIPGSGRRIFQ
jgi:hypothetical protein